MADETKVKIIVPLKGIATGEQQTRTLDTVIGNKVIDKLGGQKTITRASHVDPGVELSQAALQWLNVNKPGQYTQQLDAVGELIDMPDEYRNRWFADLLPVNGPVLGPFDDRRAALAAEEQWLHEQHIPVCQPCRDMQDKPA